VYKLVGEEVHLIRDERDKFETFDEACHLVLSPHFHLQRIFEKLIKPVSTPTCRHDLHSLTHFLYRHMVDLRRPFDQHLYEFHAFVDLVRLEPFKVQGAAWEVM